MAAQLALFQERGGSILSRDSLQAGLATALRTKLPITSLLDLQDQRCFGFGLHVKRGPSGVIEMPTVGV